MRYSRLCCSLVFAKLLPTAYHSNTNCKYKLSRNNYLFGNQPSFQMKSHPPQSKFGQLYQFFFSINCFFDYKTSEDDYPSSCSFNSKMESKEYKNPLPWKCRRKNTAFLCCLQRKIEFKLEQFQSDDESHFVINYAFTNSPRIIVGGSTVGGNKVR